ncbi:MAG: hypothetical protein EOM31_00030 [Bacteroidia bacterium]|nr:hypothetical protein [Bacteroidia bacterium]
MKRTFTTNSRLVNELFANYISTFTAFCELINNSIQADAKNIWIDLHYTDDTILTPLVINKIKIKDDGKGVHINELDQKILDIGTANKSGGKGIGRFAAFQIGKNIEIETIGYSNINDTYSKATIPLAFDSFGKNINVTDVDIETNEEILKGKHKTCYQVTIFNLYDSTITDIEPKKKIIYKFLKDHIQDSIFERYPLKVFNNEIRFHINGKYLQPSEFVIGTPQNEQKSYFDKSGKEHKARFSFIHIKNLDKRKIFLTTLNAGIQTIATGFEYEAEWLSPKIGGWFVYIACDTLPSDMYRNIDLDGMDENVKHYKAFIKDQLNVFFKDKNKEFDNFIEKLQKDEYYPYKEKSSSKSKTMVFDKLAYLVEDRYNILNEKNKLREIVYPLIDRTISNGEFDQILRSILKLNNKMVSQFSSLLEKTELDNVIEFSDKVARKMEDIDFIEKLVYSEISKNVKERKELHKFLEKMLWIFGEEYSDSTRLLSDKNLEHNLKKLRDELLEYKASKKDDNLATIDKSLKSITDLFMYSEKIIDYKQREVLIVELKAPKVKISPKELGQAMKYATAIEKSSVAPANMKFKILLVSSEINDDATFQIKGEEDNQYLYFRSKKRNIEVWVMKWADIIENTKRKLKYMSAILETKDMDVQEKANKDFSEINFGKTSSTLKKVTV